MPFENTTLSVTDLPEEEVTALCVVCDSPEEDCECVECSSRYCTRRVQSACDNCEQCDHCCGCYRCDNCDALFRNVCGDCERCEDCCSCDSGVSVEHYRRSLTFSTMVPERQAEVDILLLEGKTVEAKSKRRKYETFDVNPLRRFISLEVEVNNIGRESDHEIERVTERWRDSIVGDGSLDEYGIEINTQPTNGDAFLDHITSIYDAISAQDGDADHDNCGLHVHIDVSGGKPPAKSEYVDEPQRASILRELERYEKRLAALPPFEDDIRPSLLSHIERYRRYLRNCEEREREHERAVSRFETTNRYRNRRKYAWYDIRTLTQMYAIVEPAMFELCHPRRMQSSYSAPCSGLYMHPDVKRNPFKKGLLSAMYGKEEGYLPLNPFSEEKKKKKMWTKQDALIQSSREDKYHSVRYNALNLHSFFHRGTIEFRHKEGVSSGQEAINWALTCSYLVEAAFDASSELLRALERMTSHQALLAILPDHLRKWALGKWGSRARAVWKSYWDNISPAQVVRGYQALPGNLSETPQLYTYNHKAGI